VATDSDTVVREGLSTITKGTLFLLVSTLALVGLTFVSRVLIVRNISPTDWSAYSWGLSLGAVLAALGSLGLPNAIARSLPYSRTDAERRSILRTTLWLGGLSSAAVTVVLFLFAVPIGDSLGSVEIGVGLQYFSIAVGTSIFGGLIASVFQGYEDVTPNALFIQILNPALFVVFLVVASVLPSSGLTYRAALLSYALANAVMLGMLVLYTLRYLPRRLPPGPLAPEAVSPYLRFAAPLLVVTLMFSIVGSGDTLILGIYHPSDVGSYTVSLTLARLLQIGVTAAAYIFLPVASKFLRQNELGPIATTYTTVTKWLILVSLPLFLLFFFLPSSSLNFVYGPAYSTTVLPLQIVVVGAFATTILGPAPTGQVAFGHANALAVNAVVAGLVDVVVAFALVPTYTYVGAAIAWSAANATYTALSAAQLAASSRVHPFHRHFVVPVVATAVPVGLLLWALHPTIPFGWKLPVLGLGIAGLFVVLVVVTRSIDEGDRLLLEAVERLLGRPLPFVRRLGRYALRRRLP
jgi:O-antigen/teichoic acid export membrane protein